jgi:ankyrin repeat protein
LIFRKKTQNQSQSWTYTVVEGRSLLSLACSYQCDAVVRMLMDRGLDEMHRDNHGWTPLHEATYSGNENIVNMLLNYGSNLNDLSDNEGKTSLYYACQEGHLAIVRMLVDNGASIEQRAHDGNSPFRLVHIDRKHHIYIHHHHPSSISR